MSFEVDVLLHTTIKQGGDLDTRVLPEHEGLLIVTIEGFERCLQRYGDHQGIEGG